MSLTILKIGGSLITEKDIPLTPNIPNIRSVARAIRNSRLTNSRNQIFLIHGGGSFGHYYAKKYGLNSKRIKKSTEGTARTRLAMFELHSTVLRTMIDEGVNCETIVSSELIGKNMEVSRNGRERSLSCFANKLIPITFGNVHVSRKGSKIVSGDSIALALARSFGVARVIFAMDVEGIYQNQDLEGEIITTLIETSEVVTGIHKFDVTGGIRSKIDLGFKLSKLGADVFYVNGSKSERLLKLLKGMDDVKATRIPSYW